MAFKWDFNIGHLLTAVPLVVLGGVYIITDHNAVTALTTNYTDIKKDMKDGFDSIRNEIHALPTVQANMDQFKARLDESGQTAKDLRAAFNADHEAEIKLSSRVDSLSDKVKDMAPIVESLDRASKIPLGRK